MARLYSDENFPLPVVEELRRLGHDVLTIHEEGKANQRYPDEAVLADATSSGRAVLTLNRKHFIRLHDSQLPHGGLILCTYDPDFVGQAQRISEALRLHSSLASIVIRINRPQS